MDRCLRSRPEFINLLAGVGAITAPYSVAPRSAQPKTNGTTPSSRRQPTMASNITVSPVAGRIGALIEGVNISQPLSDPDIAAIQQALDDWGVVFFRGQHLDHATQIAFGRRFGDLTYAHPY